VQNSLKYLLSFGQVSIDICCSALTAAESAHPSQQHKYIVKLQIPKLHVQVTQYLGYASLKDFFPTMDIRANPGCLNPLCVKLQAAYKVAPSPHAYICLHEAHSADCTKLRKSWRRVCTLPL
jgi:hypothetical protein